MKTLNQTLADLRGSYRQGAAPFNLLRWFSLASLLIIASVALGLGYVSTRLLVNASVERDALLTAQFVRAIGEAEIRHGSIYQATMGEILDPRLDDQHPGNTPEQVAAAREEYLDHIANLPDSLLALVYARDHTVVWATDPAIIGKQFDDDDELEEAFESSQSVSASYHKVSDEREEQQFLREPQYLFIENYIPMVGQDGKTVKAMVEIYKEPQDLVRRIQRGYVLIWLAAALGGLLIYGGLFWLVRRAGQLMGSQQKQLVASETFAALGEMSSAVAHSLRNPLASIRSSAELAHELVSTHAVQNIDDIIGQVDRMSRWVAELLASLRPSNEVESVDLVATLEDVLAGYMNQIRRHGVQVAAFLPDSAPVVSQQVLLRQILNSLVANALEAMPTGGTLGVTVGPCGPGQMQLLLSDTGRGMTPAQERQVFKPFYTTKQGGLGVGLVLVKKIMERFGGTVSLTSREQEGTRVSLIFSVATGKTYGIQHSGGGG